MKPIVFGAVLGLLLVVAGVPLAPALAVLSALAEPVTVAFAAGAAARPLMTRMQRRTA